MIPVIFALFFSLQLEICGKGKRHLRLGSQLARPLPRLLDTHGENGPDAPRAALIHVRSYLSQMIQFRSLATVLCARAEVRARLSCWLLVHLCVRMHVFFAFCLYDREYAHVDFTICFDIFLIHLIDLIDRLDNHSTYLSSSFPFMTPYDYNP